MTTKQAVELRVQSGEERTSSGFVLFLYHLLRDQLPVGKVEYIVDAQVVNDSTDDVRQDVLMTNGFVARYAKNIVLRLAYGHRHVYKVRDRHTQLFIDGTDEFDWVEEGRTWRTLKSLRTYLTAMRKRLKGLPDHVEVVKFALVEVDSTPWQTSMESTKTKAEIFKTKLITYKDE